MSWLEKGFKAIDRIFRESDWARKWFGLGSDPVTDLPLSTATAEGTFLGLEFSTWFGILLLIFLIAIFSWVAVEMRGCGMVPSITQEQKIKVPAEGQPSIMASAVHDDEQRRRQEAIDEIDRINNAPCKDCEAPSEGDADWEARLQRQRLNALVNGDMMRYHELIQEHLQIYKKRKVDPCKNGFFPQVCSH
jgi:hypothetical protein